MKNRVKQLPGVPLPFGVSVIDRGCNFAVFSKNATAVVLQLYLDGVKEPTFEIRMDPKTNRTGEVWHVALMNLPPRFHYTYRAEGPWEPETGLTFDDRKSLTDPYAGSISGLEKWGEREPDNGPVLGYFEEIEYDWEKDRPLGIPLCDSVIYELHVRGFSRNPNSCVAHPGTYRGIAEKVDYLKDLGITAVELLPIHEFDETDCSFVDPRTEKMLLNYWGYSSINFFALKKSYAAEDQGNSAVVEFRNMVKALHAGGIEVILDVVFNHTAEGGWDRPTMNFKGLENGVYYILDESGDYRNYSGCGNTMNCNHPVVRKMIMDALRYWVVEMHVDGFRFDLASILTRDENGHVLPNPPLLELIAKDPVLADTKIIAEAWDAAGLYQVGSFPASKRWAEWNGRYRDLIRKFCRGEVGLIGEVATRISGSEDLYGHSERNPYHSINFITAHDGFTMMDLVSYHGKHNAANGENGRDGSDDNFSMNFGVEGPTSDSEISAKRKQQIRNMAAILMLSQGTPMILAGDEFGRTQRGNNNAWCQDNEVSWLDWDLLSENQDLFRFWRKLIRFREKHPILRREAFFTGRINTFSKIEDISWHNVSAYQPAFDSSSNSLAFLIDGMEEEKVIGETIYVAMNFYDSGREFELPTVYSSAPWKMIVSTSDPNDFINDDVVHLPMDRTTLFVEALSISVLTRECRPSTKLQSGTA
ncbi:MAG: glycogen debranching protein GlgX [Proteobacteria bacterium]|nr:glycogen debranching protein GlgX [Pseudomonadota bacterium]